MNYSHKKASIFATLFIICCFARVSFIIEEKLYSYYSPAKERTVYHTQEHKDDTLCIAYIGDSWAYGHKNHSCQITKMIEEYIHCPVKVESYGIGGLTSKEIYHALFEINNFKYFIEKGYDYCYISAGINDANKKMSSLYYKESMNCIIHFMLDNHIHPIIQEIPDYNIIKAFDDQKTSKKLIRWFSMLINSTSKDCKQDYRDALDELINEKGYKDRVSVIRYKSWNNDYENDLKRLYINDEMHLNEDGYAILDSIIAKTIFHHYTSKHYLSHDRLR